MKHLLLLPFFALIVSCQKKHKKIWETKIPSIISSSSPQCIDLNGDGIKDIIMGAGADEWEKTDQGIIALNGANGQLLWKATARNQIVGSAVFLDINLDNTPDVIIGGRSAELQALNGKTGHKFWEFYTKQGKLSAHDEGWYNFFNPQLVIDQDGDGQKDILISNGGNALMEAGTKGRPAGKLLLLSSKTGKILAQDTMPDGAETYFSAVCIDCDTNPNPNFLFGSGGESQAGHLYKSSLENLNNKTLFQSTCIDSSLKGFIAPAILINAKDGNNNFIVNFAEGITKFYNGKTLKPLFTVKCDSAEVYSQPAVGNFYGDDNILDFFVNYAKGEFPIYKNTVAYLINGKTGKIVQQFSGLAFTYSSPLVADLDQNGVDEVIMTTISTIKEHNTRKPFYQITVFNFADSEQTILANKKYGACYASTPWIGDLDNNGKLDLIYSGSPAATAEFPGTTTFIKPVKQLDIFRYEFENIPSNTVKWGNYMGKDSKSIFN